MKKRKVAQRRGSEARKLLEAVYGGLPRVLQPPIWSPRNPIADVNTSRRNILIGGAGIAAAIGLPMRPCTVLRQGTALEESPRLPFLIQKELKGESP